ncbi:MAG: diaminopimelate decarboxylase [Deltaproteobacteria bacterium]|nr:diaminopimelate decarboxylase [Deltaproteobacteria bacterium]
MKNFDAKILAKKFGTPLYIYDAARIRENYRRLDKAFRKRWPNFKIFYAVKANSNPHVVQLLLKEGAGCDCASANEILLARHLKVPGNKILFSGNNLSDEDIQTGLKAKAFMNLDDISLFPKVLKFGRPKFISFRINPAIGKSNVHASDELAGKEAKFGIPWEKALEAYRLAQSHGVKEFGVHMMTGSCVTDPQYFADVTRKLLDCVGKIAKSLKIRFSFIDVGGGFGIPYEPNDASLDIGKAAELVTTIFRQKVSEYNLGEPALAVEPGRYFVGDAGFILGRVHCIKESYQKFVGTDVGMNILARPVLYGAYHGIDVVAPRQARDSGSNKKEKVTITGQTCENADAWAKDRLLPKMQVGDLILVENAGAYGFVMSYPYNGRFRAAEVLIDGKKVKLIRRRETLKDWLSTVA